MLRASRHSPPGQGVRVQLVDGKTISQWVTGPREVGERWAGPSRPVLAVAPFGDEALVVVVGAIDRFATPAVRLAFEEALASGATRLVLDVAQLDFIDSAGLRTLAATAGRLRERGGDLVLVSPPPGLVRLLDLLDLRSILTVDGGPST